MPTRRAQAPIAQTLSVSDGSRLTIRCGGAAKRDALRRDRRAMRRRRSQGARGRRRGRAGRPRTGGSWPRSWHRGRHASEAVARRSGCRSTPAGRGPGSRAPARRGGRGRSVSIASSRHCGWKRQRRAQVRPAHSRRERRRRPGASRRRRSEPPNVHAPRRIVGRERLLMRGSARQALAGVAGPWRRGSRRSRAASSPPQRCAPVKRRTLQPGPAGVVGAAEAVRRVGRAHASGPAESRSGS